MKYFFHADTEKYRRRLKSMMIIVFIPLFAVCVFCTANLVMNLRADMNREFIVLMLAIIAGTVFIGMVFGFTAAYFTEKLKRRHSRYTYFDILPDAMVYSVYAGEFIRYGERIIYRRLYFMRFESFESVSRDPKTAPDSVTIKGEIREFLLPDEHLGYHVENGETSFDERELNERGFTLRNTLEVSGRLGSTKRLEKSINYYFEQYKNKPEKKPFNIAEHITRKRKAPPRTSNPILDAPRYDRKW
ncbi:MAG: hypothetical protein K2G32_04430 [Oscillospiraceae bacterium]|nr:hypothetical protein [Oscillospiraceae bacterium]